MTETTPYIKPETGSYVAPDGWKTGYWEGGNLMEGLPETTDKLFPGSEFRIPTRFVDTNIAVNIVITGRKPHWFHGQWRMRCRIEWVGDCEPSTFSNGWIYSEYLTDRIEFTGADEPVVVVPKNVTEGFRIPAPPSEF